MVAEPVGLPLGLSVGGPQPVGLFVGKSVGTFVGVTVGAQRLLEYQRMGYWMGRPLGYSNKLERQLHFKLFVCHDRKIPRNEILIDFSKSRPTIHDSWRDLNDRNEDDKCGTAEQHSYVGYKNIIILFP